MYKTQMVKRMAERDCCCRGCGKTLHKKVDEGVFWYSSANRGMNIILCLDCCKFIGQLGEGENE